MGRLRTKAVECQYKDYSRFLTQQIINGLNGDGMLYKILKEVATLEDTEDTTSECVLLWVHMAVVQQAQKSALNGTKGSVLIDTGYWRYMYEANSFDS